MMMMRASGRKKGGMNGVRIIKRKVDRLLVPGARPVSLCCRTEGGWLGKGGDMPCGKEGNLGKECIAARRKDADDEY
jgi:hypothetical protein